jgi:hypothetical protein
MVAEDELAEPSEQQFVEAERMVLDYAAVHEQVEERRFALLQLAD